MAGVRRSFARQRFRPQFSTGVTQGDRWGDDELTPRQNRRQKSLERPGDERWRTKVSLHISVSIRTSQRGRKRGWGVQGGSQPQHEAQQQLNFDRTAANCENHGGGELGYPVRSKSRARASQGLLGGKRDIGEGSRFL